MPAAELASQRLYRVRYQGPEGDGSLRLTLRLAAPDRFELSAADPLGRARWSLRLDGDRARVVDHERREYCRTGSSLRVPEVALAELPVESLPRVLLGRLPVPPPAARASAAEIDFRDQRGRRWTARLDEGAPASWTLWEAGEPLLWWQPQPRGGVLSHRRGAQFRWRETVAEPLAAGPSALGPGAPPEGYREVECDGRMLVDSQPGAL